MVVSPFLLFPALINLVSQDRDFRLLEYAKNRAEHIAQAAHHYAEKHGGVLPPSLSTLADESLVPSHYLDLPLGIRYPESDWQYFGEGLTLEAPSQTVLLKSTPHPTLKMHVVARLDGTALIVSDGQPDAVPPPPVRAPPE